MPFSPLFAIEKLNTNSEDVKMITEFGLYFMGAILVAGIGFVAWHIVPALITNIRETRAEKNKAANNIWYDAKESVLHCGLNKTRIEPTSLEHYVCKITFNAPTKYYGDMAIFNAKDHAKDMGRGVEQAVRRLNKKAKELGLKHDLFKRGRDSTSVNDEYRKHIVKN